MNTFNFIGTILKKDSLIKITSNGKKYLKFTIVENENNSAIVQMYGDNLIQGAIPVLMNKKNGRNLIKFEDRFDKDILRQISFASKYIVNEGNGDFEFIWKDDFMGYVSKIINAMPENTIYEVSGEYNLSFVNGKKYNNFNIKTFRIRNDKRPELTMSLDLFYDYKGLDQSDKRNKFILNAYIEQYSYANRKREYYPLQVQFVTNRFDFKKATDVDIIIHRRENMNPKKEEGYVKATWECQYVKGAQLILPPIETLPKDIQFEIKNAGRDLKEYMNRIVGEADEYICLTRPNNTLNQNGQVYTSLNCTNNEFESNINKENMLLEDDNKNKKTIDDIAKQDAFENPFN